MVKPEAPLERTHLNGHIEVVKYLASRIADVNVKDTDGSTPYDLANQKGHIEVENFLVLVSTVPENAKEFVTAIENGTLESLKQLLQQIG